MTTEHLRRVAGEWRIEEDRPGSEHVRALQLRDIVEDLLCTFDGKDRHDDVATRLEAVAQLSSQQGAAFGFASRLRTLSP